MKMMKKIVYAAIGLSLLTGTVWADSEMEVAFKGMDTDENGKVTLEEFQAFYKTVFKTKDKNADGVLDEEEFANPDAFEFTDKNKDGKIDPAEDEALRANHFKNRDQNSDEHLTLDEWLK